MNKHFLLGILIVVLVSVGVWYFGFGPGKTGVLENTNTRAPLPESHPITEEERVSLGLAEGVEGNIVYGYDETGAVTSYIEITGDTRLPDADGDGVSDAQEAEEGTKADTADSDGDGWLDADELKAGTDPNTRDTDGDGLADLDEYSRYQSDPTKADTDGDGFDDGTEVEGGFNPNGEGRI